MNANYKVSIGVPVYNAERYIERCARSLFEQTYDNLEFVFVDDCSKDNSLNILLDTLNNYPKCKDCIKIIRHEKNEGVAVARNHLLDAFTGVFISFVDADDYLLPNAISLLVEKQKESNADLVTGSHLMDCGDEKCVIKEPSFTTAEEMLLHLCRQSEKHENFARIYRYEILKNSQIRYVPKQAIGEDWLFLVRVVKQIKRVAQIDDVVYVYDYTNQQSAMHKVSESHNILMWRISDVEVLHAIKNEIIQKGCKYVEAIDAMMCKRIEDGLLLATSIQEKKSFNQLRKYIPTITYKKKGLLFDKLSVFGKTHYNIYRLYVLLSVLKGKTLCKAFTSRQ